MKNYKFLLEVFLKYRISISITCLLLIFSAILEGIGILTLLPLLTLILADKNEPLSKINQKFVEIFDYLNIEIALVPILLTVVVIMLLKITVHFFAKIQIGYARAKIMKNVRIDILKSSLQAKWKYFTNISSGRLLNVINKESISASRSYSCICEVVSNLFQLLVYLFTAILISSTGTVVVLFSSIFMFITLYRFIKLTKITSKRQTDSMNIFSKKLIDLLLNIKPILAMGNLKKIEPILYNEINNLTRSNIRLLFLKVMLESSQEIIKIISLALMLYFIMYKQLVSFESIIVMSVIFIRGIGVIGKFQKEWQIISIIEYPYKTVQKTINIAKKNIQKNTGRQDANFSKSIELINVSFKYGIKKKIFDNLSIKINNGEFLTIIGLSGIGKTTLIDIIIGLLEIEEGEMKIDGVNIKDVNLDLWKKKIGYVPQETLLFNDTLFNNIILEDSKISKEEVRKALIFSGMKHFLQSNPEGLETIVGEGGRKLSGGQKQRISLARAIIKKPKLLILDEATSSLDEKTENQIVKTIMRLKNKMTIIAVTHRKALKKVSDKTYTIRNKKICKI